MTEISLGTPKETLGTPDTPRILGTMGIPAIPDTLGLLDTLGLQDTP